MRKLILGLFAVLSIGFMAISCDKEEIISENKLPGAATTFISTHFGGLKIMQVEKEKEGLSGSEYTVIFDNGVSASFDKSGNWNSVEALDTKAISTSFIPENILSYIEKNYPTQGINSIDKENYGYDVELQNGMELIFDKNGNFTKIDL